MLYATERTISLGITAVELLPENSRRVHAIICNMHALNKVYISLVKEAVASEGLVLNPAGGNYEIGRSNYWAGRVTGIADGVGTTLGITEVSI